MEAKTTYMADRRNPSGWLEQRNTELNGPHPELARVLENRRWEPRDEPFRGFGSPPGRF